MKQPFQITCCLGNKSTKGRTWSRVCSTKNWKHSNRICTKMAYWALFWPTSEWSSFRREVCLMLIFWCSWTRFDFYNISTFFLIESSDQNMMICFQSDKVRQPEDIDTIVTAELPDKAKNPKLYELVTKNICTAHAAKWIQKCSVWSVGLVKYFLICYYLLSLQNFPIFQKCRFKYPREYVETTLMTGDGNITYRRRNIEQPPFVPSYQGQRKPVLENIHVVPYNAWLLYRFIFYCNHRVADGKFLSSSSFIFFRYQCHINVEICSTIKAAKYLFKYVLKGPDHTSFNVKDAAAPSASPPIIDEIQVCEENKIKPKIKHNFLWPFSGIPRWSLAFVRRSNGWDIGGAYQQHVSECVPTCPTLGERTTGCTGGWSTLVFFLRFDI